MIFVRSLVLYCLRFNILFRSRHIPGFLKARAHCLSRFQVDDSRLGRFTDVGARGPSAREVVDNLKVLLGSSISEGSKKIYQRAWNVYSQFSFRFGGSSLPELPLDQASVALFISFLSASYAHKP